MAILHYKDSPLLSRIEIHSPRPGITGATIIANANADIAKLEQLRNELGKQHISTLMDTVDGCAAIQVRGLKNEKSLLESLTHLGFAPGNAQREVTPEDHKKNSLRERVRGKSLYLSSLFYDLGNICFVISGIQRGRHNKDGKFTSRDISEGMIGVAFAGGDVLMTAYGHERGDEELKAVSQGLKRHLNQKGIRLPQQDALNPDTLHQTGIFKASDRWLRKHIVHVKCLTEFLGGILTIHSGLRRDSAGSLTNPGKLAAGFLITMGWGPTFLLEKPRGEQILDGNSQQGFVGEVKNNPRAWIAQPMAISNNLFNLWGSLNTTTGKYRGERARFMDGVKAAANPKDLALAMGRRHDYIWNVISACSFIVAHGLFGLSGSKRPHETKDDTAMMQDLVLLSANVLAKQPEKLREIAIDETAEYVSKLAHVNLTKEQVAAAIHEKVADLSKSAWATRVQQETSAATPTL